MSHPPQPNSQLLQVQQVAMALKRNNKIGTKET
jgi:hypothetical protein